MSACGRVGSPGAWGGRVESLVWGGDKLSAFLRMLQVWSRVGMLGVALRVWEGISPSARWTTHNQPFHSLADPRPGGSGRWPARGFCGWKKLLPEPGNKGFSLESAQGTASHWQPCFSLCFTPRTQLYPLPWSSLKKNQITEGLTRREPVTVLWDLPHIR